MATATWLSFNTNFGDEFIPTARGEQPFVGLIISGSSKTAKRRAFIGFDLTGTPDAGTAPGPGDNITDATLTLSVTILDGPGGWTGRIERISRADWYGWDRSSWNNYSDNGIHTIGYPWTTPGGDVDADPSLVVPFTSPLALGAYSTGGLLPLVADAYHNRFGLLLLRLKGDNEGASITGHFGADYYSSDPRSRPRLSITYSSGATIDERDPAMLTGDRPRRAVTPAGAARPASGARAARPRR